MLERSGGRPGTAAKHRLPPAARVVPNVREFGSKSIAILSMAREGASVRILLAVLEYLPALGGSTRLVQTLAEGAVAQGHEVTVLTQAEPDTPDREVIGGVTVERLAMRRFAGLRIPRGYLSRLRQEAADVFHLHGNRIWCADYYFPFARSFPWPQAISPFGFYHYWMRRGLVRSLYYRHYLPGRLRAFQAYIALTTAERDQVVGWGYPADRVRVIPPGIDLAEFSTVRNDAAAVRASWGLPNPHVAVFVGGLYDNKRVDRCVRAIARTRGEWGLVVIGKDVPGTPYDRLHCEALARELSASVRFLGPQPRASVLGALGAADAFVQGSSFEGFGIALLEAMASGLPFVAFDAGGARDLATSGAGFVVGSELEMADRLGTLIERRDEMRKAGPTAARDHSASRMVEQILETYRSIGPR